MNTPVERTPREYADILMVTAQRSGITEHRELAIFMAQAQVETENFQRFSENLSYRPERLLKVFPGRNGLDTLAEARAICAGGPESVANAVYGGAYGRKRLGNVEDGDGWRFHGRGYFQLTGRYNYETFGEKLKSQLGVDVVAHPDRMLDPEIAAAAAVEYWRREVVSQGAHRDVDRATGEINAARLHLDRRRNAAAEWERKLEQGYEPRLPDELMPQLPMRPIDPAHPARSLFDSALSQVETIERERNIANGAHTMKLSLALTAQALDDGLDRIDRVELNDRGTLARAVQVSSIGDDSVLNRNTQPVDIAAVMQASNETLAQRLDTQPRQALPEPALAMREAPRMALSL